MAIIETKQLIRPAASVIARLHPLSKVAVAAVMTLLALGLSTPLALSVPCLFVLLLLLLARIRLRGRFLLGGGIVLALVVVVNYLIDRNPASAAVSGMRLLLLFMTIPVTALTTNAQDLARALAACRLPSGIVLALMLVWRFIPFLMHEQHAIGEARLLRGLPVHAAKRFWWRAGVLPLIFTSIHYADRLTLALELRGFAPGVPRTWYRVPRWTRTDTLYCLIAGAVIAGSVLLWLGEKAA